MPDVQECPHCEKEITQADIEERSEADKKERFDKLFWDQPAIKRLMAINYISLFLLLFGAFGGMWVVSWLVPGTNYPREMDYKMILGLVAGAIPGIIAILIIDNVLDEKPHLFKAEHWSTFESGN